jgi:demethoxyubiquinone hydroxylase (CLK1/Coq7/Cat5 family)
LASESVTDEVIEMVVNRHFDKNLQEIKNLRKQIRKLDKGDESRKEIRNKIRLISKANKALIPFSKRQRIRISALVSVKR